MNNLKLHQAGEIRESRAEASLSSLPLSLTHTHMHTIPRPPSRSLTLPHNPSLHLTLSNSQSLLPCALFSPRSFTFYFSLRTSKASSSKASWPPRSRAWWVIEPAVWGDWDRACGWYSRDKSGWCWWRKACAHSLQFNLLFLLLLDLNVMNSEPPPLRSCCQVCEHSANFVYFKLSPLGSCHSYISHSNNSRSPAHNGPTLECNTCLE